MSYINTETADGVTIVDRADDTINFKTQNDIDVEYIILDRVSDFNPDDFSGTIIDFTEDIEVKINGQNLRLYKSVNEKNVNKVFLIKIL